MEKHLASIDDEEWTDDVRMERAYPLWFARRHKELVEHLAGFPEKSNRYTEARYYEGLAHHLLGDDRRARAIWKTTLGAREHGPWIYRADWAYATLEKDPAKQKSLIGRIGYFGLRNPDLEGAPEPAPPKMQ